MRQILLAGLLLVSLCLSAQTDKVIFQGQLLRELNQKVKEPWWRMSAIIKIDDKLFVTTPIDNISGEFTFTFSTAQHKTFDLFIIGLSWDTSFIKSFSTFDNDTVIYKFRFPLVNPRGTAQYKGVYSFGDNVEKVL
jgi:hypothetical protein